VILNRGGGQSKPGARKPGVTELVQSVVWTIYPAGAERPHRRAKKVISESIVYVSESVCQLRLL